MWELVKAPTSEVPHGTTGSSTMHGRARPVVASQGTQRSKAREGNCTAVEKTRVRLQTRTRVERVVFPTYRNKYWEGV